MDCLLDLFLPVLVLSVLPFLSSLSPVLALQAFVPPCVTSVVTQSCSQKSQTAAARSVVLQARAFPLICLTVIVFEKQVDTYAAFSSSIPVLLYFKMVLHYNLDSLNCKRAVREKGVFYPRAESSCIYGVSNMTGHVSPGWKQSQLSWNFIVNWIVFKNSTDFQFSFLGSVIGALFNGIFIRWPTKARTLIIPHAGTLLKVLFGKDSG